MGLRFLAITSQLTNKFLMFLKLIAGTITIRKWIGANKMSSSSKSTLTQKNLNSISRVQQFVGDRYFKVLYEHFGDSFLDYRERWSRAIAGDLTEIAKGPLHVDLELSNSCNYKCSFCPYSAPVELRPDGFNSSQDSIMMPLDLARKVLYESRECGALAVEFGYNTEPLLYPYIFEIISYAKELGFIDIRMGTNGSLLNPANVEKLLDSGLTQLQVSIDAVDSDSYKLARQSNLYSKVTNNINGFLDARNSRNRTLPVLRVTYVMTPENKKNADIFYNQWKNLADIVALQDLFVYDNVNESQKPVDSIPEKAVSSSELESCYMPKVRLSVKSDGTVHPCCTVPGMSIKVGNVNESGVAAVWNCESMQSLRTSHLDGTWIHNKICLDCMLNG